MKSLLVFLFLTFISFSGEITKGPFVLKSNALYAKEKFIGVLSKNVKVVNIKGIEIPLHSLEFARVLEIERNTAGQIEKIKVLGWED